MSTLARILHTVDAFVWGPYMLILLVGTGVLLCVRTRFLPWRRLPRAVRDTLRRSARSSKPASGAGGISPFAALMTSLAATIGTGNIIGVSTALVSGGPGALVWMWIAAAFGIASKFSECMLAVKYREVNSRGEMVGGPMYTLKKAFPNRRIGAALGFLFALFALISSFGIGNLTQANSIADALDGTFLIPRRMTGLLLTALTLLIIAGGIRSISKITSLLVPSMAILYIAAGLIVLAVHFRNIPLSLIRIVSMAFSAEAVTGGFLGTITASAMRAMRFGVARGVFSNEAGMGSAAVTAASAAGHPIRQGYLNMTATFWDTIVVCTITGLCIMSSGVLGNMQTVDSGSFANHSGQTMPLSGDDADGSQPIARLSSAGADWFQQIVLLSSDGADGPAVYDITACSSGSLTLTFNEDASSPKAKPFYPGSAAVTLTRMEPDAPSAAPRTGLCGSWRDPGGGVLTFCTDGAYEYAKPLNGAALTIAAFRSALGDPGACFLTISISLFAFSTILGWEYLGERAFEYLVHTHRYNLLYRILFSCAAYAGAVAALDIVWDFSNIANALMAVPNLLCLLALSGEVASDLRQYEAALKKRRKKPPPKGGGPRPSH